MAYDFTTVLRFAHTSDLAVSDNVAAIGGLLSRAGHQAIEHTKSGVKNGGCADLVRHKRTRMTRLTGLYLSLQ
jgi:hypothetical protein